MTKIRTVLFIGAGNMGAAIIGAALGNLKGFRIAAIDPEVERAKALLDNDPRLEIHAEASSLEDASPDLLVLGVKPQVFEAVIASLPARLLKSPVLSIMAGVPIVRLERSVGHDRIIRVMPNLPALVGRGMSLGHVRSNVLKPQTSELAEQLFRSIGEFQWVGDESILERAMPAYACGPGFLFAIAEQMINAAIAIGISPQLADHLVRQTFLGTAEMLAGDERTAEELKRAVTSPNGTTQAGLGVLERVDAMPAIMKATFEAAYHRALELGG